VGRIHPNQEHHHRRPKKEPLRLVENPLVVAENPLLVAENPRLEIVVERNPVMLVGEEAVVGVEGKSLLQYTSKLYHKQRFV
jgi:hypothetical protein